MTPILRPRTRRSSSSGRLSMRRPASDTAPPAIRPGGSIRPTTAMPVIDLPAPDSPTTPSTSPGASENETPSTTVSTPCRVANSTRRSATSSTLGAPPPPLPESGIERITQPVAEDIEGEYQRDQGDAGEHRDPPGP